MVRTAESLSALRLWPLVGGCLFITGFYVWERRVSIQVVPEHIFINTPLLFPQTIDINIPRIVCLLLMSSTTCCVALDLLRMVANTSSVQ
jgi:hypothetical protein